MRSLEKKVNGLRINWTVLPDESQYQTSRGGRVGGQGEDKIRAPLSRPRQGDRQRTVFFLIRTADGIETDRIWSDRHRTKNPNRIQTPERHQTDLSEKFGNGLKPVIIENLAEETVRFFSHSCPRFEKNLVRVFDLYKFASKLYMSTFVSAIPINYSFRIKYFLKTLN